MSFKESTKLLTLKIVNILKLPYKGGQGKNFKSLKNTVKRKLPDNHESRIFLTRTKLGSKLKKS